MKEKEEYQLSLVGTSFIILKEHGEEQLTKNTRKRPLGPRERPQGYPVFNTNYKKDKLFQSSTIIYPSGRLRDSDSVVTASAYELTRKKRKIN